jgi:hypothetical protein
MQALGYECAEADDPYAATAELLRRPLVYRALILSLTSLFREELAVIGAIRRKLSHVEVWLTHIEGRQAALVEAIRLGAAGLLADDGELHPFPASQHPTEESATSPRPEREAHESRPKPAEPGGGVDEEPTLTADELRALLQQPDDHRRRGK